MKMTTQIPLNFLLISKVLHAKAKCSQFASLFHFTYGRELVQSPALSNRCPMPLPRPWSGKTEFEIHANHTSWVITKPGLHRHISHVCFSTWPSSVETGCVLGELERGRDEQWPALSILLRSASRCTKPSRWKPPWGSKLSIPRMPSYEIAATFGWAPKDQVIKLKSNSERVKRLA